MIAKRKTNTLIIVHRRQLLDQWIERLKLFLDLEPDQIGMIGGGKHKPTGVVDVAIIQSLIKKNVVDDVVAEYGQIIVDECHHLSAVSFEAVAKGCKAKYFLGLTASAVRKDGHHPIIFMQCGPMIMHIHPKKHAATRPFEHRVLFRQTAFSMSDTQGDFSVQNVYYAMIQDVDRNAQIIADVVQALSEGRSPLVLTERVEHLNILAENLEGKTPNIFVLRGGIGKRKRKLIMEELKSLTNSDPFVILATGRFAGEGFDVPRLDTLFLAMPISWQGTLQQYVGRLHRTYTGKKEVQVYDYIDQHILMLQRMLTRRMKGYKAMGYATEAQMGLNLEKEAGST